MKQAIIQEPVAVFLTIVAVILLAPLLLERIQLPGIVGLIVGGVLIGPHGFGLLAMSRTIKFVAAWLASKLFRYGRNEALSMWGLSQAQAAATLATLLVGLEADILPQSVFDGAILMVLATSITSPLIVQRFGGRLEREPDGELAQPILSRVLVPVANPDNQENLIRLGAFLAQGGEGTLIPVHVAREVGDQVQDLKHQDRIVEDMREFLLELELEAEPVRKVASSVAKGIRQASIEARPAQY